jgi:putative Mg2+ transporter-C (MgtC) family protein
MLEVAIRLAAATIAGSVIGLNRDLRGKPAGVRTHALVALGSAMSTLVIFELGRGGGHADPNAVSRVVQGIITGVGFLGAGVIMRDAAGHVSGLTTAATIWVCATLGTLCGLGSWGLLLVSLGLVMLILLAGGPLEQTAERLFRKGPPS